MLHASFSASELSRLPKQNIARMTGTNSHPGLNSPEVTYKIGGVEVTRDTEAITSNVVDSILV